MMIKKKKISLDMKQIIDKYYFEYGEGSCQHSFVTNFCLKDKYDDMFCEYNSYLYVLRNGLEDENYRHYLLPMGDKEKDNIIKNAIDNIIDDAKQYNKKVAFNSITEKSKNIISKFYKDRFVIEDSQDLYEYIYNIDDLAYLQGPKYHSKRNEVSLFFRKYKDDLCIKLIGDEDINNIKQLFNAWIEIDDKRNANPQLLFENKELLIALENYKELNLIGTVIYIQNDLAGFVIGTKLNNDYVDEMIEKGDIKYKGVYKVLNSEFPKMCMEQNFKYVNFEEDLGVEGLRNMKKLYHPSHYIKKFIAREV